MILSHREGVGRTGGTRMLTSNAPYILPVTVYEVSKKYLQEVVSVVATTYARTDQCNYDINEALRGALVGGPRSR